MKSIPAVISLQAGRGLSSIAFARWLEASDGHAWGSTDFHSSSCSWSEAIDRASGVMSLLLHLDGDSAVLAVSTKHGKASLMLEDSGPGEFMIRSTGTSDAAAKAAIKAFVDLAPPRQHIRSDTFDVKFWSLDPQWGATRNTRALPRLSWEDTQGNYPSEVRPELERLVAMENEAPKGGRLMIFFGPPGTGKSRFLQTIGTEWASWCDLDYIVDPDAFFASASYMSNVALSCAHGNGDRWRLLVCEDADEFIDEKAKATVGQGVARLLNLADGLVGQGLRLMILASTNVRSARFSPAITRKGRCGAMIKFPAFPQSEAAEWLDARGLPSDDLGEHATLGDLYGRIS